MCDEADKQFFDSCTEYVGKNRAIMFYMKMLQIFEGCQSPIEKVFIMAFCTLVDINNCLPLRGAAHLPTGGVVKNGIEIIPQMQIGEYRVDFCLNYWGETGIREGEKSIPPKPLRSVIVEVDGHGFHDKDQKQRGYENKRNRFLQGLGYKVFHYTGAEINNTPMKPALECLLALTGKSEYLVDVPSIKRRYLTAELEASVTVPPMPLHKAKEL